MKIALDTNAYSSLARGESPVSDHMRTADRVAIPVVVMGELRFGFLNGAKPESNEMALQAFLAEPRVSVLDITVETTWLFGEIATFLRRQGVALSQNDIWIASLCKQYGFLLATRDRDFRHVMGLTTLRV